ncbi:MAG: GntR family transcriptional regulator, partial [Clostridia bacterium]
VAFVECNSEQLDFFTRSLELGAGVRVLPVLIDDLLSDDDDIRQRLREMDLVVTTFFHLDEVREVLGGNAEVLGIALDPEMETMVRLAQVPSDRPVALICLSRVFAQRVRKSLEQSGLAHLDTRIELSRDPEVLQKVLSGVGAAIVSPGRRRDVERLCPGDFPIIEFIYKPDAGSVNALQRKLIERYRNRGGDNVGIE